VALHALAQHPPPHCLFQNGLVVALLSVPLQADSEPGPVPPVGAARGEGQRRPHQAPGVPVGEQHSSKWWLNCAMSVASQQL
jgi:hypothetical protein